MPITITGVRFSYCNLFQPKAPYNNPQGEPKYSCTVLVPKTNTAAKAAIDQAVAAAIEAGVSAKWSGIRPPQPAICVHDGDGPRPSDGSAFGEECRGCWVFTASSKQAPFVVDAQVQPIIDPHPGLQWNVGQRERQLLRLQQRRQERDRLWPERRAEDRGRRSPRKPCDRAGGVPAGGRRTGGDPGNPRRLRHGRLGQCRPDHRTAFLTRYGRGTSSQY